MPDPTPSTLSRRERQILDVLYARGRATAAEVLAALPDAPSYSAVRALLRVLEDKGHVVHEVDGGAGRAYVYRPAVAAARARRSALRHLVTTFFGGSAAQAAAALLDLDGPHLTPEEAARLADLIARAQREGR